MRKSPAMLDFFDSLFYYTQSVIFDAMLKEYKIQFIFAQIFWLFEFLFFHRTVSRKSCSPSSCVYTHTRTQMADA